MTRTLVAIAFIALAYTALVLAAQRLGPDLLVGAAMLVPLIGIAWAFGGRRD